MGSSVAVMPLPKDEREQFLAEPHIAALSVSAGPDRGPLTLPIWYQYRPGEDPWVTTVAGSRKHKLIEAAGHFSLMVERLEPTIRYVAVDGPVAGIEPTTDDELREMVARYLPPEQVQPYMDGPAAEHGAAVTIRLRAEHWLSADLGGM